MTIEQFNSLKVNDLVYIPGAYEGRFTGTQVLKIDRLFKKVTVLLGTKSYSYRYVRRQIKSTQHASCFVGLC